MGVGLLSTAVSGLQAFQRSISVAGHNISNANTEGYTRQRVELGTRPPSFSGQGYIGNGVQIEGIERLFDQFVVDRLRDTSSSASQYETLFQFSERVSNILGDADAGLSAGLESFFDAVQTVADDPASMPARQLLLSESDSLVARFQNLDSQLQSIGAEINGNLGNIVTEINGLSAAIADANKNIAQATSQGSERRPMICSTSVIRWSIACPNWFRFAPSSRMTVP
jgi:flagellar hook-associated protein 1 FlgK